MRLSLPRPGFHDKFEKMFLDVGRLSLNRKGLGSGLSQLDNRQGLSEDHPLQWKETYP